MNKQERKKLAEKEAAEFMARHHRKIALAVTLLMFACIHLYYNGYEREITGVIVLVVLAYVFFFAYCLFKLLMWPISEDWP